MSLPRQFPLPDGQGQDLGDQKTAFSEIEKVRDVVSAFGLKGILNAKQ
jgi:hypothetical protein